jgi:hypothetical protein
MQGDGTDWITEGAAQRSWVRPEPVVHLLVRDGEWRMWCSGGEAREAVYHVARLCARCRQLARAAVADGTLDEQTAGRWL